MIRVIVDDEVCTGHGRCYSLAPDVFDADDAGHCRVLHSELPESLIEQAKLGEASCPESAIRIENG